MRAVNASELGKRVLELLQLKAGAVVELHILKSGDVLVAKSDAMKKMLNKTGEVKV